MAFGPGRARRRRCGPDPCPEWYGPLPVFAACDHGKSVYCGAALDIDDPAQARQLRQRVEQAGIAFMAEFPRRLAPATLRLKELIATRIGAPKLLFCHRRSSIEPGAPQARRGRNCPTMLREMIEQVDWCRYVASMEPTSVVGIEHGTIDSSDGDDYRMMSLDFSPQGKLGEGPIAQISCGRYMPELWPEAVSFRPPAALQVCCEQGVAFIDLPSTLIWFDAAGRHMESLDSERPVGERLMMHFYRAVTSLVRKTDDADDAYRRSSVVLAARQSFDTGTRVYLPTNGDAEKSAKSTRAAATCFVKPAISVELVPIPPENVAKGLGTWSSAANAVEWRPLRFAAFSSAPRGMPCRRTARFPLDCGLKGRRLGRCSASFGSGTIGSWLAWLV